MDEIENYTPEIGQACFGQPWKEYAVSNLLRAVLMEIAHELDLIMNNNLEEDDYNSPFCNTGSSYANDVSQVQAYSWDDSEKQIWNFKWKDVKISWYKHARRG